MNKDIILIGQGKALDRAKRTFDDSFAICLIELANDIWIDEIRKKREVNDDYEMVVCANNYLDIGKILFDEGYDVYYVCLGGLLFHCDKYELMSPVELYHNAPYNRTNNFAKSIFCFREEKISNEKRIVQYMKNRGYDVVLLTTSIISDDDFAFYSSCYCFTSMKGIQEFVKHSTVDIIHCFTGTNIFASLSMLFNLPLIYEVDIENISNTNLVLEYSIYRFCSGIVFDNCRTKEAYEEQFGRNNRPCLVIENTAGKSEEFVVEDLLEGKETEDFYAIVESEFTKI